LETYNTGTRKEKSLMLFNGTSLAATHRMPCGSM
jgi:hypothetical protein